jgi:hypothetical protein
MKVSEPDRGTLKRVRMGSCHRRLEWAGPAARPLPPPARVNRHSKSLDAFVAAAGVQGRSGFSGKALAAGAAREGRCFA